MQLSDSFSKLKTSDPDDANAFIVIEPSGSRIQLKTLWEYRELLYFLTWKELKIRYKQTILGVLWVILQPLLTMVVFTLFFSKLAGIKSESGIPYPLFTFAALLPWQLFANSLSFGGNSLIHNQQLITKVYFPRLLVPLSAVLTNIVDFSISMIILILLFIYYGIAPAFQIFYLPAFFMLAVLTALAVSLWLAALNVRYRDVRYTIPFLTQIWLFATPVVYPVSIIPEQWKLIYGLNPMVGVVEGFRWALLGKSESPDVTIFVSAVIAAVLFFGGLLYFRKVEKTFADIV